jgi:hypothetical protein
MSFKDKIMNVITAHPKLVTFGIGLGITFVIGTAIGMVDHNQAFAYNNGNHNGNGNGNN